MSCLPSDWSERERRLMRALRHAMLRNHPLVPATCAGCLETASFVVVPGYQGDLVNPTCVVMYDSDPGHYRDEQAGLKHGHDGERR